MSDLNNVPEVPENAQAQSAQVVPTTADPVSAATSAPDAIPATPQIAAEETATTPGDGAAPAPDTIAAAPQLPIEGAPVTDAPVPTPEPKPKARIFKIGATRIVADANTAQLDNEQVRTFLKPTYPEVANALIRETNLDENTVVLEFLAQPGRKG